MKVALAAAKHDWDAANLHTILGDNLALSCVADIYIKWCRICAITKTALKWSHCIFIRYGLNC
jgi:hypothetical protein